MQTTYLRQTALSILNSARVAPTNAGDYQVWVTVPKLGDCMVRLQTRETGFGDSATDVLRLDNGYSETLTLRTSPRSLALMQTLVAQAESKTMDHVRSSGLL